MPVFVSMGRYSEGAIKAMLALTGAEAKTAFEAGHALATDYRAPGKA
jgi:hypothetical protein